MTDLLQELTPETGRAVDSLTQAAQRLLGAIDADEVVTIMLDEVLAGGARACWIGCSGEAAAGRRLAGHRGVPDDLVARLPDITGADRADELLTRTSTDALWLAALEHDGRRLGVIGAVVSRGGEPRPPTPMFFALARLCAAALHRCRRSVEVVTLDEHRRAVRELEELRQRNQLILDAAFEGIYGLDLEGRTTFVNRAALQLTGWSPEDMLGRRQHDVVHHHRTDGTPYPPEACSIYATLRDGQVHQRDDEVFWRKDGSSFSVAYASTPVRDEGGAVRGAVVTFRDISARRRAEVERERLRQRIDEERRVLALVLESLPVGVLLADAAGRIHRVNPAAVGIWEDARLVGPEGYGQYRGWWPDSGRRIEAREWALARAIERGETTLGELIEIETFRGNRKLILNSALPICDGTGRILGGIVVNEDVTERIEQERLREEWVSVIAHDLRQPVNTIGLRAAMLEREANRSGLPLAAHAAHIRKSAAALDRLIADLLDVSRLAAKRMSLDLKETDLTLLVRDVVDRLGGILGDLPVRLELSRDVPRIYADPGRIEQILGNLLSNAAKYGDGHSEIRVRVATLAGGLHVSVTNRGAGISPAEQAKLFRRFERTAAPGRRGPDGIGLGLYITRGLVEAHGGCIWVESTPGEETTFHFVLPVRPNLQASPHALDLR